MWCTSRMFGGLSVRLAAMLSIRLLSHSHKMAGGGSLRQRGGACVAGVLELVEPRQRRIGGIVTRNLRNLLLLLLLLCKDTSSSFPPIDTQRPDPLYAHHPAARRSSSQARIVLCTFGVYIYSG